MDLIRPSPSRGHGQSDGWRQGVDGPSDVSVRQPRTPRGELREGCTATKSNMSAGQSRCNIGNGGATAKLLHGPTSEACVVYWNCNGMGRDWDRHTSRKLTRIHIKYSY